MKELLTCSQDNEILLIVKLLNVKFDKQSKQNKDDISEIRKELQELIENKDDTVEMRKQLEKVLENQNVQSKELKKLRKQSELHTNGTSHASDAPRYCLLHTIISFVFRALPTVNSEVIIIISYILGIDSAVY